MYSKHSNIFETSPLNTRKIPLGMKIKEFDSTSTPVYEKNKIFFADAGSTENYANKSRLDDFKINFSSKLIQLIKEQQFEYGIDSPADALVRDCMLKNSSITKEWINEIYNENYDDINVIIGLLRVVSRFSYIRIAPQGVTMALAAFPNKNQEVREAAIRAFESWGNLESLTILKNISIEEEWLSEYLNEVISDLNEELV